MQLKNIVVSKGKETYCILAQALIPGQKAVNLTYDCNTGNLVVHEWFRLAEELIDEIYAEFLELISMMSLAYNR